MGGDARPHALVMMATYNGAAHVEEQVESILAQRDVDVVLRICDDCSTDGTWELLQELARNHANVIATQNEAGKGVGENFMQMVYEDSACGHDLFAFSDQDDIWHPEKLICAARAIEDAGAMGAPTLYFSDVTNFDGEREWPEIARFASCESQPRTLLLRNWVNGCAMVFNRELLMLLRSYRPAEWPRLHDTWVHMVARFCGRVIADYGTSLSRRRIHASQTVGATRQTYASAGDAAAAAANLAHEAEHVFARTAALFLEGYASRMDEGDATFFELVASAPHSPAARLRLAASRDVKLPAFGADALMRLGALLNRV